MGADAPFLDGVTRLVLPVQDADGAGAGLERFPPAHSERIRALAAAEGGRQERRASDLRHAALVSHESGGRAVLTLSGVRLVSASAWWDPAAARVQDGRAAGCLSAEPMGFDRSPPSRPRSDWRRAETVVAPSEWPV